MPAQDDKAIAPPPEDRHADPEPTRPPRSRAPDALVAAVPIILVNFLAVVGQSQWAGTHLHWNRAGQALFAGALETVALAVMYLAHRSLIEGDSAVRLRLGAYLIASGSAAVNYEQHSAGRWQPTPAAFVFAGCSLLSPVLWAMYSRFASREVMRTAGLIDRRAAKFSLARWIMFPFRTFRAFRWSVWNSVQSPTEAIAGSDTARTGDAQVDAPQQQPTNTALNQRVDAAEPGPAEVDTASDSKVDAETAKALIAAGWLNGESVDSTVRKSGRSRSWVYRQFNALDERHGARPRADDTAEIPLVTAANGTPQQ